MINKMFDKYQFGSIGIIVLLRPLLDGFHYFAVYANVAGKT